MKSKTRSIRNMLEKVGAAARPSRQGFTLLELLIAVGALALVSVGVAAIFEATGRTVQTGRRVSAMASYASLIERRMREDFSTMTRDGFLIIRNEYATKTGAAYPLIFAPGTPNPDAVPLTDSDENARLRRTDEIMFFVKGQFVSSRELLDRRYVAKSDAAALYYGHGERARVPAPPYNPTSPYYQPTVTSNNSDQYARLGYDNPAQPPPAPTVNPNKYASDWILVRRETLLRPAQNSLMPLPPMPLPLGLSQAQMTDSDIQIALQPAASNLFRSLASMFPTGAGPQMVRGTFDAGNPAIASGLVDIVTTDLAEIKAIVCTADRGPGNSPFWTRADVDFFDPTVNSGPDGQNHGVDGKSRLYGSSPPADQFLVHRIHGWMDDALPAWSTAIGASVNSRTRIRCETAPNNYVGVLANQFTPPSAEDASRRVDQLMLASSNFLPHCTEFIVEWSFGMQYTSDPNDPGGHYNAAKAGQLVWYGMPRVVNGDLVATTYELPLQPGPPWSGQVTYPWDQQYSTPFTQVDGAIGLHPATAALIHDPNFNQTQTAGEPVTSYFGYTDPTFNPDRANAAGGATPDGNLNSPGDSRSPTIPWAWPKFIRVTMSLADPNNPSVEQSFQFVFDVPAQQ